MPLFLLLLASLAAAQDVPAKRLLVVADSHTQGFFGKALVPRLEALEPRRLVEVYAACGSSPSWFLPGGSRASSCGTWFRSYAGDPPKAVESAKPAPTPEAAAMLRPDTDAVVIALGTNMADWRRGALGELGSAWQLAAALTAGGARCVWIGPPPIPGFRDKKGKPLLGAAAARKLHEELNAGLRAQVSRRCAYVESRAPYRGADGAHYDQAGGEAWAAQVLPAVAAALR